MGGVTITELIDKMGLRNMTPELETDNVMLVHADVNRPALQLTGFFDHFDKDRVQIIGYVENAYISTLTPQRRREMFDKLLSSGIPCLVYSRGMAPEEEVLELCNHYGVPCMVSEKTTSDLMAEIIRWLNVKMAPMISIHGVLVDVFGEGVLIMGESGIGKSELAIELVKRGHRLIADDAVELRKVSSSKIMGMAPENIRHFIELRGIGIINVARLFGIGAVKNSVEVEMVIELEAWDRTKNYDRTGLESNTYDILGVKVPSMLIPVMPGRKPWALSPENASHQQPPERDGL